MKNNFLCIGKWLKERKKIHKREAKLKGKEKKQVNKRNGRIKGGEE